VCIAVSNTDARPPHLWEYTLILQIQREKAIERARERARERASEKVRERDIAVSKADASTSTRLPHLVSRRARIQGS